MDVAEEHFVAVVALGADSARQGDVSWAEGLGVEDWTTTITGLDDAVVGVGDVEVADVIDGAAFADVGADILFGHGGSAAVSSEGPVGAEDAAGACDRRAVYRITAGGGNVDDRPTPLVAVRISAHVH